MRLGLGLILMFVGGAVVLVGIVYALLSLGGLYDGFLEDALGQPDDAVDTTQQGMYKGVIIGAVGIVPFIIGSVMVKGSIVRKLIRARNKSRNQLRA
jgi:hypothetical protein